MNGIVKGYVNNLISDADIRESDGKLDVGKIVGKGTLQLLLIKDLKNLTLGKLS